MSCSTRSNKAAWRLHTESLASKDYFESCPRPQDISYQSFLIWSRTHLIGKAKVRYEWSDVRKHLHKSQNQLLRDAALRLDKAWAAGADEKFEIIFFKEQQAKRQLLRSRLTVHTAADNVIVKRQRLELEEEGRSLDEGQQSNKANLSSERDTSSCEKEGDLMTVSQSSSQNSKQSRRVSFGQSLALEDLKTPGNLKSSVGSSLPSTDPDDASYCSDQDLRDSTSKVFTWNYLDGSGRLSSHVDTAWTVDGTEVGRDLMEFRDRVVRENGALTKPYEKLAVNFIFLVEAEYQTGGLQGQVEDQSWESMCDAVKDTVLPLADEVVTEAHRWAHKLAQNNPETFLELLEDSPPQNRTLKSILMKMVDTYQLWNTQARNEDTYLKSQLGPFLETYFGKVKYTKSDWTPVQDDTRSSESTLLIPDYATTTQVGDRQLFIVLLEGKIARNSGIGQNWDDLSKLGHELKAALDSILKLEPEDEVCVIGLLIREPVVEFYTMQIHAEATYVMHKFGVSYISPDAMNAFPLVHLMEVFAHAKVKIEKTVAQIRRIKVHASPTPKVPLSWLRPSFKKPKRCLVADGQ